MYHTSYSSVSKGTGHTLEQGQSIAPLPPQDPFDYLIDHHRRQNDAAEDDFLGVEHADQERPDEGPVDASVSADEIRGCPATIRIAGVLPH